MKNKDEMPDEIWVYIAKEFPYRRIFNYEQKDERCEKYHADHIVNRLENENKELYIALENLLYAPALGNDKDHDKAIKQAHDLLKKYQKEVK